MHPAKSANYLKYLLFLPLLTPFFVGLHTTPFPFIILKAVYLAVVVGIIVLLSVVVLFRQKTIFLAQNRLLWSASMLLSVIFLSTVFSVNFRTSFWGTFERMEGFIFLLPLFSYFILLVLFLTQEKDWRLLLKAVVVVGWGIIFLGLLQYFAPAEKPFITLGGSNRVFSTLGNFIYLGHFSLYIFWLSFVLFFQERKWRWVWVLSALWGAYGVYLAQSRGPFLGLILSIFLFGFVYLFIAKNSRWRLIVVAALGIIVVFLVSAIFIQPRFFQKVLVVSGLQEIRTLGGSADTRLMAWEIAWQAFKEKPLLGWGNFSYQIAFNKFYNPNFLAHGWGETWFDHSHNQFMDTLANQGLLGFVSFLSLFVFSVWLLIKKIRQQKESRLVSLSALGLLGALFINYLFAFDNISTYLFFFVFLAWLVFWTSGRGREIKNGLVIKIGLVVTGVVGLFILYSAFTVLDAAKDDRKALVSFQKDPVNTIGLMRQAIEDAGPYAYELRSDFAQAINGVARPESGSQEADLFIQLTKEGIAMLEENIKINFFDVRRQLVLGQMYKDLTLLGLDYTKEAVNVLEKAKELSPRRQQIYYYLAEIKLLQGDYDGAVAEVQKTFDGIPGVYQGYWFLAKLEGSRGNWLKAKEYLGLALEAGFQPTLAEKGLIRLINNGSEVK